MLRLMVRRAPRPLRSPDRSASRARQPGGGVITRFAYEVANGVQACGKSGVGGSMVSISTEHLSVKTSPYSDRKSGGELFRSRGVITRFAYEVANGVQACGKSGVGGSMVSISTEHLSVKTSPY